MSQWNIFAVVPYCKCLVMRFSYVDWRSLLAKLRSAKVRDVGNPTHETLRGFVRVDGDAPTSATGIAGPAAVARSLAPGLLPGNAYPTILDDEAIGRRRLP